MAFLFRSSYSEAFVIYGLPPINAFMNIWIGLMSRSLALLALTTCNRPKLGLKSWSALFFLYVIHPIHDMILAKENDDAKESFGRAMSGLADPGQER